MNMKDISRAGHVKRWHSVRTLREQTLAEHQYLVTMIARELALAVFKGGLSATEELALTDWALRHDTPELLMGDIATPVKRRMEAACPGVIEKIEESICSRFTESKAKVKGTPLEAVVKIADLIDGLVFITVEGTNDHADIVKKKYRRLFKVKVEEAAAKWPELEWAAANRLLDEMLHGPDNQIEFE